MVPLTPTHPPHARPPAPSQVSLHEPAAHGCPAGFSRNGARVDHPTDYGRATREAGLERWGQFLPQASRYAASRNRVVPGHPHVSRLSPWVRSRLVTTQELVEGLLAAHRFGSVEKLVQELVWRDYWKGWLEWRPAVWRAYRAEVAKLRSNGLPEMLQRAEAVMEGRGGVAVMDRFARELTETGYLHNHARMWWAGYWCHVERLPWALGADFFYRHLLDADPASNTLGWRWVAGLQTRGKAYLPRWSNLERYCAPEWLADSRGMGRLDDAAVTPCPLPPEAPFPKTRWATLAECPDVAPGRWGLWIHGEDLTPELSALGRLHPAVVATVLDEAPVRAHGLSAGRVRWMRAGLEDARRRAGAHYGCPVVRVEGSGEGMPEALVRIGREHQVEGWVSMRPCVGPLADQVDAMEGAMASAGMALRWCRRAWDEALWPHAQSGFFPFWEKVGARLSRARRGGTIQGELAL